MVIRLINIIDSKSSNELESVPYPSNRQIGRKTGNRKTEDFFIMHDSTELANASEISTLQCRHTLTISKELTPQKCINATVIPSSIKTILKKKKKKPETKITDND
jgi:hypothetical protein